MRVVNRRAPAHALRLHGDMIMKFSLLLVPARIMHVTRVCRPVLLGLDRITADTLDLDLDPALAGHTQRQVLRRHRQTFNDERCAPL